MAMNKQTLNKLGLTLWLATAVVMPNLSSAAPGTLASVPLFTQGNVDPNILLHLDSSGSMNHVMVESSYNGTPTYDASTTYDADANNVGTDACVGGLIPDGSTVYLDVDTSGATVVPKIKYDDGSGATNYDLGNDTGEKCFSPTGTYNARLTTYPTLPITLTYSGNYLNWYFNPTSTTGTWSTWTYSATYTNYKKPQTRSRMDVAQASLTTLVNSLYNVRVGVSKFRISGSNFGLGADIIEQIDDIGTGTQRADVLTAIDDIVGHGGTPLAEAERDIGRYFSNATTTAGTEYACGGGSTNLTLHPGTTDDSEACTDVLGDWAPIKNLQGPIQYSCQANFVIYTTDGLSSHDIGQNVNPGASDADLIADSPLEDYDLDCTNIPVDGSGNPLYSCSTYDKKNTYTYTTNAEASDYLDDVAQALYEVDLRPDLNDVDGNAVTNNVRTYVIGFADDDVSDNQLLQDTASQGGGSFIYAEDANALTSAFENASSSILNLIGSAAAVTFNSATLGTDSAVYLALFNSSSWTGDLIAYDLNDTTGAIETKTWSAADNLDALTDTNAVSNRTILTYRRDTAATPTELGHGIPFRWPADHNSPTTDEFNTDQINDLLTNPGTASTTTEEDTLGQARVDFLRGKTSLEGTSLYSTSFRGRNSRLGDIIHAGPIYVGPPELTWPDGDGGATNDFPSDTSAYSYYKLNDSTDTPAGRADRPGVVYVGSNDGMLHGFATEDGALGSAGDEVLAYAPRVLFSTDSTSGYHYLTQSSYNHNYYVDLQPTVSDIYTGSAWKTVLVGGLRGGGRGLYALDVSDPENFSESNAADIVLWEFTNEDDTDLGYTFSQPTIGMMEDGRWAVIVGSGYNPDTSTCATCEASLYVIYLDADLSDGSWDAGGGTPDYRKFSTKVGDPADLNGLSTPAAVDLDNNGQIDTVYVGDLKGNMWVFTFPATGTWGSAYKTGSTPDPLFAAGSTQPITAQPEVAYNTDVTTASGRNTLVLFGTGQYVASGDNANLGDQTFYGVWDHGSDSLTTSDLIEQELAESSGTRTITNADVDYDGGDDGWFINFDLNSDGERMVTNPVVRGDYVYFNTSIPTSATCEYGGTGWQMAVNFNNGHNPSSAITDTNGDNVVNGDDSAVSGMTFEEGLPAAPNFLGNRRYTPGTRTQSGSEVVDDAVEEVSTAGTGRLSWEELTN